MRLFRMMTALFCCCLLTLPSFANFPSDEPITFEDLPVAAQQFIQENFSHITVTRASYNCQTGNRSYEVNLSDNTCLRFDEIGLWTAVESQDATISPTIVPSEIVQQIYAKYPGAQIRKIEKMDQQYEVTLLSRETLLFDAQFHLLEEDADLSDFHF